MKTRIYLVKDSVDAGIALIRAANRTQALAHFAKRNFTADLPSQEELLASGMAGIQVEDAAEEAEAA